MKPSEAYGFVGWISTFLAYFLFLLWAYVPESILHTHLGITYYPAKHWALTIPCFAVTAYALSGVVYVGMNLLTTAPLDSFETLTDRWTRRPPVYDNDEGGGGRGGGPPSVPYFADEDIGVVNHFLYDGEHEGGHR